MVFSSMIFLWLFFPAVFCGYYVLKITMPRWKNLFLLITSLLFYAWGEPKYIILMIFSIVLNYYAGILLSGQKRKYILWLDIFANLLLLFYFKYLNFFVEILQSILQKDIEYNYISLPIGISFFTFQAIAYVVDVYRGNVPADRNIANVALYISFFPQLIAGPIVKYKDIETQIKNRNENLLMLASGIRRFCYGLAKKVLIANVLGEVTDRIVGLSIENVTGAMAWLVAIFYTLQIYYDFSGYSDMAIGLARMFGFEIEENFKYPYLAKSINEFWRKWHISLGSWFREYVYIPLGGNRFGHRRTYINLFLVFLLTGIWHGAAWNFLLWGIYYGIFIVVERAFLGKVLSEHPVMSHFYTMFIVINGWVIFRFTNITQISHFLKRMYFPWEYTNSVYSLLELVNHRTLIICAAGILGCGLLQLAKIKKMKKVWKTLEVVWCFLLTLICFGQLMGQSYNPFIYFRF